MKRRLGYRRSFRVQLASAVAAGVFSAGMSRAATPVYDDVSSVQNGVTGAGYVYTTGAADEAMGNAITLPAGTADISGFDILLLNATGTNLSGAQINIFVWGGVNLGTISSTAPAFSDELAEYSLTVTQAFNTGYYYTFQNTTTGGIYLNTPLALPNTSIGITVNYQGSTNGTTYANMPGLTSLIGYGVAPTIGSNARGSSSFDLAADGETNGNYISGPYHFGTAPYNNSEGYAARIYGDIASTTPDNWQNNTGGIWTDGTQWSTGSPPGGGADAFFNLSSPGGYTVELPGIESAGDVYIQNDNVTFDLDAQQSELSVNKVLGVGLSPTVGTAVKGSLTLQNTGGIYTGVAEPASIVVGGNGGTGTLTVTSGVYLYSKGDTAINAGSSLAVGQFAKFGTATLTIAGTTNAWTGQLDIGPSAVNIRNGSIATVTNQILSGYNNGQWNGQGIISSTAAADTTHLTAVGAIVNNTGNGTVLYGSGTALGLFDGEAPALNAVLVRYTYYGDANLDGKVDGSDYSLLDNGALNHLTGWYNGDFNYDGVINGSDYTLIDNSYNQQQGAIPFPFGAATPNSDISADLSSVGSGGLVLASAPTATPISSADLAAIDGNVTASTTAEIAPVPEPASLGMIGLAAGALLGRRSRGVRRTA